MSPSVEGGFKSCCSLGKIQFILCPDNTFKHHLSGILEFGPTQVGMA